MIDLASGILLIADPFLKDPNFLRTVVVLCEYNEEGGIGFVLNRPFDKTLDELLPEAEGLALPVYVGGPVEPAAIFFLHAYPDIITGGVEVMKNIYWGGDFPLALELLKKGELDSSKVKFFMGYSGWSAGQLEEEIKEKSWLTVQATSPLVFDDQAGEVWKNSIKQLGGEYVSLINYPIDPQLN